MKAKELKELQTAELRRKLKTLREELFWLKFKNKSGQTGKSADIKKNRRDVARLMTVLRHRELTQGKTA